MSKKKDKEKRSLESVLSTLNRQQANTLVVYLNYKKYHWLTYGPFFRDLHLLFEEHATRIHAWLDELAERALLLDGQPVADPADYLEAATVKPSKGELDTAGMVSEALAAHERVLEELAADAAAGRHERALPLRAEGALLALNAPPREHREGRRRQEHGDGEERHEAPRRPLAADAGGHQPSHPNR